MGKYLNNRVFITLPGTGKKMVRVPVKAKALTKELIFHRSAADVEHGIQGECATCANAIASVRNGLCELAQFTDSRAYLVDKFNKQGVPVECFVGTHDQGKFQRKFDKNKKALLRSDECEGIVKIRPLHISHNKHDAERNRAAPRYAPSTATQKKRERGAAARAQRAGIVFAR
jgi:hypothetical protein